LVFRYLPQGFPSIGASGGEQQYVSKTFEEVLDKPSRFVAGVNDSLDHGEKRGAIGGSNSVDRIVEQRAIGVAEKGDGALIRDTLWSGTRHELVEHGKGIPHGTTAGTHDQRKNPGRDGNPFRVAEGGKV
jgi:hypothetical protein